MTQQDPYRSEEDETPLGASIYDAEGDEADLWFVPPEDDEPPGAPLPRADQRRLLDPAAWLAGQGGAAVDLARAAMAVGRLDELVAAMGPGAVTRLAMEEVEALMWAAGRPVRREEIGRDLLGARAGADLEALRAARWALRRLEGQGGLRDLRGFLGLHRSRAGDGAAVLPRLTGRDFDEAAEGFHAAMGAMAAAHPIMRGGYGRALWPLAELSPEEDQVEGAVWAARVMAADCVALPFVPMGGFGRRAWQGAADAGGRLRAHARAVEEAAQAARGALLRLREWEGRAHDWAARVKGGSPARVVAVLLAHPIALTATVEAGAGVSRDTAERLLARMAGAGLVREVTGARRFRLWQAAA